mmetsp:Transcript_20880/g.43568  ORF Transcript_20880/g.43568 Transcript_20880/m.43568 type:complete len:312 (+) Transcript_20880:384-1319(+)
MLGSVAADLTMLPPLPAWSSAKDLLTRICCPVRGIDSGESAGPSTTLPMPRVPAEASSRLAASSMRFLLAFSLSSWSSCVRASLSLFRLTFSRRRLLHSPTRLVFSWSLLLWFLSLAFCSTSSLLLRSLAVFCIHFVCLCASMAFSASSISSPVRDLPLPSPPLPPYRLISSSSSSADCLSSTSFLLEALEETGMPDCLEVSPLTNFLYAAFTAASSSLAMLTPTMEVKSLLMAASSVSLERTLFLTTEISFSMVLIFSSFCWSVRSISFFLLNSITSSSYMDLTCCSRPSMCLAIGPRSFMSCCNLWSST